MSVNVQLLQTSEDLAARYINNPDALQQLAAKGGVYADSVQNALQKARSTPLPNLSSLSTDGISAKASNAITGADYGTNPIATQAAENLVRKYADSPEKLQKLANKGGVYAEAVQNLSSQAIQSKVSVADRSGFVPSISLGANSQVETVAPVRTVLDPSTFQEQPTAIGTNTAQAPASGLGTQILTNVVGTVAGAAGTYLGSQVVNATYGSDTAGLGATVLGGLGTLVGGLTGGAVAGEATLGLGTVAGVSLGSAFGGFVGSTLGGTFDALYNFLTGKTNPQSSLPAPSNGVNKGAPVTITGLMGGQSDGVLYNLSITSTVTTDTGIDNTQTQTQNYITGAISGISLGYTTNSFGNRFQYADIHGKDGITRISLNSGYAPNWTFAVDSINIARSDGHPDLPAQGSTNDPNYYKPLQKPVADSANNFPYFPTVAVSDRAANLSAANQGLPFKEPENAKPLNIPPFSPAPSQEQNKSPLAGSSPVYPDFPSNESKSPSPTAFPQNQIKTSPDIGLNGILLSTQPVNPNGLPAKPNNLASDTVPTPLKPVVPTPSTPNSPAFPDLGTIAASIIGLGLSVGSVLTGVDYLKNLNEQINNQTTAANQRENAAAGACSAMNSDTCTLPLVNKVNEAVGNNPKIASDAKLNTIIGNQIAQDGVLAGIVLQLTNGFAAIAANFTTVFSFLKNQVIDRAISMLNLAVNITNLLMLTESAGKALGGILDAVISLTPLQFTDATTGAKTTATSALGQNASALIINIIGVDNYAKLKEELAVNNRIIKSVTNGFNGLERILNSQSKQAQKTGVDVANIGNALVANNVVNQNSYPKMANSQEANAALPAEDVGVVNGKLGLLKQGIAGLNTITRDIRSKVSQVKRIQKDFMATVDLVNGESKARKQIATQAKNEAKRKAKFKFLSIKQIKAKSK